MTVDLRDVMLEVTAEVQEIMREIAQELALPAMRMQMKQLWATLPDEMKEKFKQERPDEYRRLMEP